MKVLILVDHLRGGGAEKVTIRLAKALVDKGHMVSIVVIEDDKSYLELPAQVYFEAWNLEEIRHWRAHKKSAIPNISAQLNEINKRQGDFDLILVAWEHSHCLANQLPQDKTWLWIHSQIADWPHPQSTFNPLKRLQSYKLGRKQQRANKQLRKIYQHTKAIGVTIDVLTGLEKRVGFEFAHKISIPNVLDIDELNGLANQPLPKDLTQPAIMFLGRLTEAKGAFDAIHAFKQSNIDGQLWMVGDGADRDKLVALSEKLGVKNKVIFTGFLSNPYPLLKACKCLILTSYSEGLPTVLCEAIALKTPCISTKSSSGPSEILIGPLAVGLVDVGNTPQISAKIKDFWENPIIPQAELAKRYSPDVIANEFLSLVAD
ncbi:glycosyltransferase [Persicirhabdus sediminis]|uniref:Glycosyltransferase n=1 Tax=Persicirhabdus sediminis TaxID=454144 RepID=A0A8J7MDD7_9BACT|nr:glycosyltransferase [Persicirhabdus sediminis]MBK1790520.1 glycosyltransferase [Persicirhabdus sediminis]